MWTYSFGSVRSERSKPVNGWLLADDYDDEGMETLVSGGAQLNKCLFMSDMPVSPHNRRNVVDGRLYR